MKEIFKFKQFDVNQRGCTMKINTDGVLLAVKALGGKSDGVEADRVLDAFSSEKIAPQRENARMDRVPDLSGQIVPKIESELTKESASGELAQIENRAKNSIASDRSSKIVSQVNDKLKIERILDIGTGTGVIGLMLAQRFPEAIVEAIDIDEGAFNCAMLNFENSPFSTRLSMHHTGIEDYESANHFDLIVSNPPFFINSLKNTNERKTLSRHASLQFYASLFAKCHDLLTTEGSFQIIWPLEIRDQVLQIGLTAKLYLNEEIHISSFPDSNPFRVISVFKKSTPDSYKSEKFHIYKEQGIYSDSYLELLRPFFITIT